jgi:ubiquinone/menaquinone biosynthesis C-methylase UbiE
VSTKSWQLGAPGTILYRLFDGLRAGLNARLVQYLTDGALAAEGGTVLEAGSGPAFASSMLARQNRVTLSVAMDIDFEALSQARHRDPSLCAVVGDLNHLPFRNDSVDLAWNSSTLEHLPDFSIALHEMVRVTRPHGKVFVGVPFLFGPLGFQRWVADTSVGEWIGPVFSRADLETLMKRAGLLPLDSMLYFFRFFVGMLAEKNGDRP